MGGLERLSPDEIVYWQWGAVQLNATIVSTWLVGTILVIASWLVTRTITDSFLFSRWQHFLEVIVEAIVGQIREVIPRNPERYVPFVGTLFLFIAVSNVLGVFQIFPAPTESLSTDAALALCVLVAVPLFGIRERGWIGYWKLYLQPSPLMLPFNIIGELSRTLALAVRLFGNMMSGAKIGAILLIIAPLFFPLLSQALGLLTGLIQAYIFAMLALVYIASATQAHEAMEARVAPSNTSHSDSKGASPHG